jgi:DNA-binding MarR family transcriptional regulator
LLIAPDAMMDLAVRAYLKETLGIAPRIRAWPGAGALPYFLVDAFDIREMDFLDQQILLAVDRRPDRPGLAKLRAQVEKLRELAGVPVVYVTAALASYERKRLVEQKLPFLVPGNQLYLPDLGIDLREYFRKRSTARDAGLSPATQAMMIAALVHKPWRAEQQTAELANGLGYTAMTLSRAIKELIGVGIATVRTEKRTRWLQMGATAAETWERAKPSMRNPVKQRLWIRVPAACRKPPHLLLAGLSALARHTMIVEPQWPIYAIGPAEWKMARVSNVQVLPEHLPGACEWELWHYDPMLVKESETVDPLSLALSLQDNTDERVQLALDELKERNPW